MKRPHRAFIGLGSNLQQPEHQLHGAVDALARLPLSRLAAVSSFYRSAPVDCPEPQPDYLNAVVLLETALEPEPLLLELQAIEARHGRRPGHRNAPRVLDLDLLLFDQRELCTPRLRLPHPRIAERAFVLAPLLEIAPGLQLPGGVDPIAALARLGHQRIERLPAAQETPVAKVA